MSTFKQCISHWPISKATDDEFKQLYQMGFRGVELAPQETWDKFRDMGFSIVTYGGHKSIDKGLNNPDDHARIADEIRANLELAKQYEIPHLIVFSGSRAGISDEEGLANCVEGLNIVKADAEAAGVNLIMELLNSKVNHPNYQCDKTPWGVEMVKAVGSPRVKLLYDIYHMQIMEGDLIRTLRENIAHFAHIHTAGNPGRNDLDENQEIYYPAVARAINELGYDGWVGHEYGPKKPMLESLQQAYNAFDV